LKKTAEWQSSIQRFTDFSWGYFRALCAWRYVFSENSILALGNLPLFLPL
jgi:hypothetical protein